MDRRRVIRELNELPGNIRAVEDQFRTAVKQLNEAKLTLLEKECEAFSMGKVKGRNELTRQAELWPHTKELQKAVIKAEAALDEVKVEYNYLKLRNENLQLIARLLYLTEEAL